MTDPIRFTLDGAEVEAAPGETIWQVAQRVGHRDPASVLAAEARLPRRRQLPRLHGRGRGRAGARRLVHPPPDAGHEGAFAPASAPRRRASWCSSSWSATSPSAPRRTTRIRASGNGPTRLEVSDSRFPQRAPPARRPQPSGDGGAARRLHPVQSVRAGLPRGAGQRRDRHGRARPWREDRVRFRRSDGRRRPASPAASASRPARPAP